MMIAARPSSRKLGCTAVHFNRLRLAGCGSDGEMIRMAKIASKKRLVRKSRGSGPKNRAGRSTTNLPRPRRTPFEDEWGNFIDDLEVQMVSSLTSKEKINPYYAPASVIKRCAYRFFLKYKNVNPNVISTAIENFRIDVENAKKSDDFIAVRRIRKPFKNNEFYWIITGIKSAFTQKLYLGAESYALETYDVSRFSLQLAYAARHKVPPDYLIGFLYQCGTFPEIANKFKQEVFETWYSLS